MVKKMNSKGQIAIFVIIAMIIVAMILLLFLVSRKSNVGVVGKVESEIDVRGFIDRCTRKVTEESVDIMLPQGGFLDPMNYKMYKDNKVAYICENRGNFRPCINQHPMLLNEMKDELKKYTLPKIDDCFNQLKQQFESKGSSVEMGSLSFDFSFAPNRIFVDIYRSMKIVKQDGTFNFDKYKVSVISPLYDLGLVSLEIANQESEYCYFEYVGWMALNPDIRVDKFTLSDSTGIYSITQKASNKTMNVAIRGCAIPAGI
jgi:hypothetical protein